MTVCTLTGQRKEQRIMYFRPTAMQNMTISDSLFIVKHCQKETVNSSLLSGDMLAYYTLKDSTGMQKKALLGKM